MNAPSEIWISADTNRDGKIDASDEAGKAEWKPSRGAIFMANIDDDESRCPATAADGRQFTDAEMGRHNDAADEVVNGDGDIDDLAKIHVSVPADARTAAVTPDAASRDRVRLFIASGDGATAADWSALPKDGALPLVDRSAGVIVLGIEAKDIVRDSSWSGLCTVSLVVELPDGRTLSDSAVLKVAPLLFVTEVCPMETLYAADNATSVFPGEAPFPLPDSDPRVRAVRSRIDRTQAPFRRDLIAGLKKAGLGADALELLPSFDFPSWDRGVEERLQAASQNGVGSIGITGINVWPQDWMHPAFMSMPSANGQHVIWVWVRSSSRNPRDDHGVNPLRHGGRIVFTHFRGPDCAGLQHFDPSWIPPDDPSRIRAGLGGSFDMGGNYSVVPPHTHDGHYYPQGRKIYGSAPGFTADPAFNEMLAAQSHQKPIVVDTSWLEVGHVDEFLSFVPANSERGWAALVADPELAIDLLRGHVKEERGAAPLFSGGEPVGARFPTLTIAEAIQDDAILRGAERARQGVESGIRVLRDEVGLGQEDIVRLPVLFRISGADLPGDPVCALLPDAVNLINTGQPLVFAPRQHAPIVNGSDLFETVIEERLRTVGVSVHWVEDFEYAHPGGEVHCSTNATRDVRTLDPWWLEGPVNRR